MRIAIIAALRGELAPLVKGWKRQPTHAAGIQMWTLTTNEDEVIAVCGGMGAEAVRRSFAAAEATGSFDLVLSVGWAGALNQTMRSGTCYIPSEVIDSQTGERFALTESAKTQSLVTAGRVADPAEKRRLSETYGAVLVDMEATPLARLARIRSIPFACFKAVSDAPDARLPDLNAFINVRGQMEMLRFIGYVALRPKYWMPLAHLGKASAKAARELAFQVERFLVDKKLDRSKTGQE